MTLTMPNPASSQRIVSSCHTQPIHTVTRWGSSPRSMGSLVAPRCRHRTVRYRHKPGSDRYSMGFTVPHHSTSSCSPCSPRYSMGTFAPWRRYRRSPLTLLHLRPSLDGDRHARALSRRRSPSSPSHHRAADTSLVHPVTRWDASERMKGSRARRSAITISK